MSNVVRFFNTAYFGGSDIVRLLNAIIYVANPTEKDAAHITFQGPFFSPSEAQDMLPADVAGAPVGVDGTANFFDCGQQTIFLKCHSPKIFKHWHKPDGFLTQHITLYDGRQADFATRLFDRIRRYHWSFELYVDHVATVRSVKGEYRPGLFNSIERPLIEELDGTKFVHTRFVEMTDVDRLDLIERMCALLFAPSASLGRRALA